ncbi:hypothetical protein NEOC84_000971|nr:hypothetical protein [Neochlamydia sp. AcF95]NGY95062.1 hypothetical protein [Neochlamydia sp. AcF84]
MFLFYLSILDIEVQSVRKGEWITKATFGYKNVTLPTGKKMIEVDPQNTTFVIKIFELYATHIHSF